MARFFHPLIMMLASLTRSELARQIWYLKAENEILRAKPPKRVTVTPAERRRLLELGKGVGSATKHLITVITYRTFLRWLAGDQAGTRPGKRWRPRANEEIRESPFFKSFEGFIVSAEFRKADTQAEPYIWV